VLHVDGGTQAWLQDAVSLFGEQCRQKLSGPGEREAAIRSPLESLMRTVGEHIGVRAVFHDEVRDTERRIRSDYGVRVRGAINGYIEVKAPGHPINPEKFSGHDREQWERQKDIPNLIYTNGTQWRLYRDSELLIGPVDLGGGGLDEAGLGLLADVGLELLLTDFLRWKPAQITSVGALVRAVAPLTRLLRGEVLDQLAAERKAIAAGAGKYTQPFTGLARDWRALLFPHATDTKFADGYAQTVTFALLLARTEGIAVTGQPLHEIGAALGHGHSLMGKALQLLTDDVAADFRVTLDLLIRSVGAVDWPRVRSGGRDTYLHLYEHFLDLYDHDLRKKSGTYYTPREVVEEMVRLAEDVLVIRLSKTGGFSNPDVLTVDPAMGTGTYLETILERVAEYAEQKHGSGAAGGAVSQAAERLVGFELQMGPYAVAELRAADRLAFHKATPPPGGMHLYVTDTLDDPYAPQRHLGSGMQLIADSRRRANKVKAKTNVTVVIGNPPYKELAVGDGGWVENGSAERGSPRPILEDFFVAGAGRFKAKLKNLYIYFWRWATWKVWESTVTEPDGDAGIVCFISTSGYLTGPAFTGMREYLRRHASEGWIIDLTPEGQTPDVPTRIFPGVRQPLAIGLFLRTPEASDQFPATIRYRSVSGRQADKFAALAAIRLDDEEGWRDARSGWTDPLTPAADGGWDTYPALSDLMPWYSPGVFPTRTWVYGPNAETLRNRWDKLMGETDAPEAQSEMFKEGRDATMDKGKKPLPGGDVHRATSGKLRQDRVTQPRPIRVGYRSLDRQWVLPDSRLMDMPRPDLWAARIPGQVFVVEMHSKPINDGPGLAFSALIPDFDYFKGSGGGRTLPYLHPNAAPNLAPVLVAALSAKLGSNVTSSDVLAYVAALVAHPAYTRTFANELTTPGIRVPFTAAAELWAQAVNLGEQVIWLHTYGAAFAGPGRPQADIRLPAGDPRQPMNTKTITSMPESISYDSARCALMVGDGEFAPVSRDVVEYTVGGRNVFKSWFDYRKKDPGGRRPSSLDRVIPTAWDHDWTIEAIDLLTVLTRLTELEPAQADLLTRVLTGDLLSMHDLQEAGTHWPASRQDRKPQFSYESLLPTVSSDDQGTLDLGRWPSVHLHVRFEFVDQFPVLTPLGEIGDQAQHKDNDAKDHQHLENVPVR
jgi:Type ISP C-terminal specificity domain/N-6 DNA Methylase